MGRCFSRRSCSYYRVEQQPRFFLLSRCPVSWCYYIPSFDSRLRDCRAIRPELGESDFDATITLPSDCRSICRILTALADATDVYQRARPTFCVLEPATAWNSHALVVSVSNHSAVIGHYRHLGRAEASGGRRTFKSVQRYGLQPVRSMGFCSFSPTEE